MIRPLVIAHRGASAVARENSLDALEAALNAGADMVEVDVRLSADGVPVAAHDRDMHRVSGREALVSALTADELAGLGVATFAAIARAAHGRVALLIDPKGDGPDFWRSVVGCLPDSAEARPDGIVFGARSVSAVALLCSARPSATILGFTPEPAAGALFRRAGANVLRLWEADVSEASMAEAKALGADVWVTMGRAGDGSAGDATAASLQAILAHQPAGLLVNDPALACVVLDRAGLRP